MLALYFKKLVTTGTHFSLTEAQGCLGFPQQPSGILEENGSKESIVCQNIRQNYHSLISGRWLRGC